MIEANINLVKEQEIINSIINKMDNFNLTNEEKRVLLNSLKDKLSFIDVSIQRNINNQALLDEFRKK